MKAWRERWTDSQFGTHVGHSFTLLFNPVFGRILSVVLHFYKVHRNSSFCSKYLHAGGDTDISVLIMIRRLTS
jgi:hypothetical protein